MATTLFRAGLWIILLMFALYVLRETFLESVSILSSDMLERIGMLGVAVLVLGVGAWIYEQATGTRHRKGRCQVCRRPVFAGEIYCREHLRRVLDEVDMMDRTISRRR